MKQVMAGIDIRLMIATCFLFCFFVGGHSQFPSTLNPMTLIQASCTVGGASGYEQNLCTNGTTDLPTSWCEKKNPFTIPLPTFTNSFPEFNYSCKEGDDIMKECLYATHVSATSLGGLANVTKILVSSTTKGQTFSFVLHQDEAEIIEEVDFPDVIMALESYSSTETFSILIMEEHSLVGFCGLTSDRNLRICINETQEDVNLGVSLLSMPYNISGVMEDLTLSGVLRMSADGVNRIHFYIYGKSLHAGVQQLNNFTWTIHNNDPDKSNMSFMIFNHYLDASNNITESARRRVLVAVWNAKYIHIYGVPLNSSIDFDRTVYFGDISLNSFFYKAEGYNIVNGAAFSEETNRYQAYDSGASAGLYKAPSNNIWLGILLENATKSDYAIRYVQLGEFRQFEGNSMINSEQCIENPALKPPAHASCAYDEWYCKSTPIETEGCRDRYTFQHSIAYAPGKIRVRYLGEPSGEGNSSTPSFNFQTTKVANRMSSGHAGSLSSSRNRDGSPFGFIFEKEEELSLSSSSISSGSEEPPPQDRETVEFLTENFYQHIIFVSDEANNIFVYSLQQHFCDLENTIYDNFNRLQFWGKVYSFAITDNAQHLFAAIPLKNYLIQTLDQTIGICAALAKDDTDQFLQGFKSYCDEIDDSVLREPDIGSYMYYSSMCPPGSNCPDLKKNTIKAVDKGYYTIRSLFTDKCPKGSFCPGGVLQKCLKGFICPEDMMTFPQRCPISERLNTTCYYDGLEKPAACPEGFVCPVPAYMPVAIPPGHYVVDTDDFADNRTFRECNNGSYCPLAMSLPYKNISHPDYANETMCPAFTYCSDSSVVEPVLCSYNVTNLYCSYCPAGSTEEIPCPPGYFCENPSKKLKCGATQYCPEGSMIYRTCPSGYYCPNPSKKIICPMWFFCPDGSVDPILCPPFTWCPKGTAIVKYDIRYTGMLAILAFIVLFVMWIIMKIRDLRRNMRDKKRLKLRKQYEEQYGESMDMVTAAFDVLTNDKTPRFPISFKFFDLGLALKKKPHATILSGINGEIKAGKVTAIMGPSGCGKTTFLNLLCGKAQAYAKTTGEIYINEEYVTNIDSYRLWFGFVPQEDIMLREMTVKEIVRHSALMRLPRKLKWKEKTKRAQKVIEILGLDHIRHSPIGDESKRGISGGQRKRVNIGMELVASPGFIALDEPTSGLDSGSSKDVVEVCKYIAEKMKVAVVMVIHQPRIEIYEMFDELILLGRGGRLTYMGPANEAPDYFQQIGFSCPTHVNPPDYLLDVITGSVEHPSGKSYEPKDFFDLWDDHFAKNIAPGITKPESSGGSFMGLSGVTSLTGQLTGQLTKGLLQSNGSMDGISTELQIEVDREDLEWGQFNEDADETDPSAQMLQATATDEDTRFVEEPAKKKSKIPKRPPTFWFFQILIFAWRGIKQQTRDAWAFIFDILLVFIPGLLIGIVYYHDHYVGPVPSSLSEACPSQFQFACRLPRNDHFQTIDMLLCLVTSLTAMTSSLRIFGNEKVVYWREVSTGATSTFTYFMGKNLAHVPMQLLLPFVFTCTFYTFLEPRGWFFYYLGLLMLLQFASTGFGYIISILFKPSVAQLVAVIFTLISLLFCGASPTLKEYQELIIPIRWLPWLSFLRYAMESLYLMEIYNFRDVYDMSVSLGLMGYDWFDFYWCVAVIIFLAFITRIVALVLMYILDRKKKK